MNQSESQKIVEKAYKDHARGIIDWALRKLESKEEAEDFCQEVMSRFYKMLIAKEAKGETIRNMDDYLWKIVFSLINHYIKDTIIKDRLVEDIENDLYVEEQISSVKDQANSSDTDILLEKLWTSISQLEYNHRETTIMFYLGKKSLQEISKKLDITESYVKKLLYESRNQIRENDTNQLYDTERVYHPNNLMMSFSGEEHINPDFVKITDSLTKQNICLTCYERACSIEELAHLLGFPCAYIEFDIKWLMKRGFIKRQKNKYLTNFFIFDGTFNTRLINIYLQHKHYCIDKIVDKLSALQDRVRAIKFTGCEKPINELLWLLIYAFSDMASTQIYYEEFGDRFELLHNVC